jgi:hypothetical protein
MTSLLNLDPVQAMLAQTALKRTLFASSSRYYGLDTATLERPGHPPIVYVLRRFLPSPARFQTIQEHTVTQGERLDNITALYLADDRQYVARVTVSERLDGRDGSLTSLREPGAAQLHPPRLGCCQSSLGARGNHRALLLGERCEEVQDEGINVWPKLRDQERYAVRHEPGDEMNIAAEPVELGHGYRTASAAGFRQSGSKLWPTVEGVSALAGINLHKDLEQLKALRGGEAGERFALRIKSEPGATLGASADTHVADQRNELLESVVSGVAANVHGYPFLPLLHMQIV